MIIRQAKPTDLEALYQVSLETGHLGGDASHLYADPKMMGHIYSAPYLQLEPDLAFVIEQDNQVAGFCVGTADTSSFAARLEADWWPTLRKKYPQPNEKKRSTWSADERRSQMIHLPESTPVAITTNYPAHLHMNLLPVLQGQRLGGRLLEHWISSAAKLGVTAAHIGSNANNARAIRFWDNQGFKDLPFPKSRTRWMGRMIP
ncbi:GNAT family N-acetyltransferase [bacterium]|nr:GNAT family N-acetyltransferase [bacterium]